MSGFNPREKNFVIKYECWESYNAESKEEAIRMFRSEFGDDAEIIEVEG